MGAPREQMIEYGVNEALLLQQIRHWTEYNASKGLMKDQDGVTWWWTTQSRLQAEFPFWSRETIKRLLKRLETKELIWREYQVGSRVLGGKTMKLALVLPSSK